MEPVIATLIGTANNSFCSLGIRSRFGQLQFLLQVANSKARIVCNLLKDAYPGSETRIMDNIEDDEFSESVSCPIRLSPDCWAIQTYQTFVEQHSRILTDPIQPILELLTSGKAGKTGLSFWIHFRAARQKRVNRCRKIVPILEGSFRFHWIRNRYETICSSGSIKRRAFAAIFALGCRRSKICQIPDKLLATLAECTFELKVQATHNVRRLARVKQASLVDALSVFTNNQKFIAGAIVKKTRSPAPKDLFLINASEIASIWHAPVQATVVPWVERSNFRELSPPAGFVSKKANLGAITLGRVCFRSERRKVQLGLDARRRHLYVLGKTGMGKTTMLKNIAISDISNGRGIAIVDPHGDLAEELLNYIPKNRTNDVVLFDPSDSKNAISFNPLAVHSGLNPALVADGVLTSFQKIFGFDESQAPRMIHIFRNCLLSLVELPSACLLDVQRILTDAHYRKSVAGRVSNKVVREFWINEFGRWNSQDRTSYIASLQNKLGAFTTDFRLQQILGQPKAKLNLRRVIDDGNILIVNLSKGAVGENVSHLLGTLLLTCLQQAALSRANIPESKRNDYSIVIDEFQNFATPSIATFLSEARKYRTHLILSHQYSAQLPSELLAAVLGNVGSVLTFQLGVDDAELFEKQFGLPVTAHDLANLPKYHAYCRLLQDGSPTNPFSISTMNEKRPKIGRGSIVRKVSNSRWAIQMQETH